MALRSAAICVTAGFYSERRRMGNTAGVVQGARGVLAVVHFKRLCRERKQVHESIQTLPEGERLFAEAKIKPILDEIFNNEIANLKTEKRRWSRPRELG